MIEIIANIFYYSMIIIFIFIVVFGIVVIWSVLFLGKNIRRTKQEEYDHIVKKFQSEENFYDLNAILTSLGIPIEGEDEQLN